MIYSLMIFRGLFQADTVYQSTGKMSTAEEDEEENEEGLETNSNQPLLQAVLPEWDNISKEEYNEQPNHKNFVRNIIDRIYKRRGMLWGLLSGVAISFEAILADLADDDSPPLQNSFYRCIVLIFAGFFISFDQIISYEPIDILFISLFGIFEFFSTVCTFVAIKLGNIGDVTAIQANLPIPSSILGCVLFREIPMTVHIFLLVINAIGLIIVSKPPFLFDLPHEQTTFQGAIFAAVSVLFTASFQAVTRKLSYKGVHDSWLLLTVAGFIGTLCASVALTFVQEWTPPTDWSLLITCLGLGIASFTTLIGATKGLQTESLFTVGIMTTVSIPLTYFYQIMFDKTVPHWYTIVGAVVSISTTICIYITSLTSEE